MHAARNQTNASGFLPAGSEIGGFFFGVLRAKRFAGFPGAKSG
jgi:hypothetical protein